MTRDCGDCGATPGELHTPGCDVERCPRCGGQAIGCGCIYEFCGLDVDRLEEDHPDVYRDGPTVEMYALWDAEWGPRRAPWSGEWPGVAECREAGLYCLWDEGRGWIVCPPETPGATEDLNRLASVGRWDPEEQRFIVPAVLPDGKMRR